MNISVENTNFTVFFDRLEKLKANGKNAQLYNRIREFASRSRRRRIAVNLKKIDGYARENDSVIVPGKVLGAGEITKRFSICAIEYSTQSLEKLKNAKCDIIDINEIFKREKARLIV